MDCAIPPLKKGHLYRPQKIGIKKTWLKRWGLLYPITEAQPPRLETYDSKEAASKDGSKSVIQPLLPPFNAVQSTKHRSKDFVFEVTVEDKTVAYAVDSKEELDSWLEVFKEIQEARTGKRTSIVPDLPSFGTDALEGLQENTFYDSYENMTFDIAIKPTPFSESLNLQGNYCLQIDSVKLSLLDEYTNSFLYAWPYRYLRRYGRDKTSFSMEAGRKCESGPGLLVFETKEGNDIFHNIQNFVNNISGRHGTPPVQAHQGHGSKDGHNPLSYESGWKGSAPPKVAMKPSVAPRGNAIDPLGAIKDNYVFKQKLAERKDAMDHREESLGADYNRKKPKPFKVKGNLETQPPPSVRVSDPDPVYSEVNESTNDLDSDRRPPPIPEAEYFLPDAESQLYCDPAQADLPEQCEYDVLDTSKALYDLTTDACQGDRWKDFGRTEDNIHTENYFSKAVKVLEDEGASANPEPIKPVPVKAKPLQKPLPKVRPTVRSKVKPSEPKKEPTPTDANSQMYDSVLSLSVSNPSPPQPAANDGDMYDHFVRPAIAHPVPAPRKANPSQVTQMDNESELYDHLQRDTNTSGSRNPPNPYSSKQQSFDLDDTYDTLARDDKMAGMQTSNSPAISLPEESQYSEAILAAEPSTSSLPPDAAEMEENPYDVVAYS